MDIKPVYIDRYPIKLGQFLKYSEVVTDGLEAKLKIENKEISVNGVVETRRGRQLFSGDHVCVDGKVYLCTQEEQ